MDMPFILEVIYGQLIAYFLTLVCSIHNGVIAVFQRKGLPDHELYNLNEGVR